MKKIQLTVADFITFVRIIGTLSLIFITPLSTLFFIIYSICGVSDVLDGLVARATKTESRFGAKLDSIADLLFYFVSLIKIFGSLLRKLPFKAFWAAVIAVIAIRIVSYSLAAVKFHCFSSLHTYLNKITGFGIFMVPYFIVQTYAVPCSIAVCILSAVGSIEELLIHIVNKEYDASCKTIFSLHRPKKNTVIR